MTLNKIKAWFKAGLATIALGGLLLGSAACGAYDDGYAQAYVVGKYTCVNPNSGQPDYCVEYSDGTSSLVPFGVYNTLYYGSILDYTNHRYVITRSSSYSRRYLPDVYHVSYHVHTYGSVSSYGGMSFRNKAGRVVYRSPSGATYHSSSFSSSRH